MRFLFSIRGMAALRSLRKAGVRLALLSNMTAKMLQAEIRNSQLDGMLVRRSKSIGWPGAAGLVMALGRELLYLLVDLCLMVGLFRISRSMSECRTMGANEAAARRTPPAIATNPLARTNIDLVIHQTP